MIPLRKSKHMNFKYVSIFLLLAIVSSCSSTDDGMTDEPVNDANYFPLVANNTWNYNNIQEADGQEPQQSMDVLTVQGTTAINGSTYFNFNQEAMQQGFATGLFSNGAVRKSNNRLLYTGTLEFEFEGIEPLQIPILDATVYNKVAVNGTQLYTAEHSITQTIMDIPIVIDFVVTTADAGDFETYAVGSQTFEDVIAASVTVNVSISAQVEVLGDLISIPILQAQDVVTATNYYAANVGLVFSDVSLQYEAED